MIQPIYVLLVKIGLSAGIAILVLTMLVKLILTPVTWKMYVSSAKMRFPNPPAVIIKLLESSPSTNTHLVVQQS